MVYADPPLISEALATIPTPRTPRLPNSGALQRRFAPTSTIPIWALELLKRETSEDVR